jgi:acyl dehydratase
MLIVKDLSMLESMVGSHVGYSSYKLIEQSAVDLFAQATGDHQWIHVDPIKAASGPFGVTIAHGYLTLSLIPILMQEIIQFENVSMVLNYGCNKVRFITPVPVGSLVRLSATIAHVEQIEGGVQLTTDATIELKDAPKPACVAQTVGRIYK